MASSSPSIFRKNKILTVGKLAIIADHYLAHSHESTVLRTAQNKMQDPEQFVDAAIIFMHVVETSTIRKNQAVAGLLQLIQYNQEKNLRIFSPDNVIELCKHILLHTKETEHFNDVAKHHIAEQQKQAVLGQAVLNLQHGQLNIAPVLKAADALIGHPHQTPRVIEAHQIVVSFLEDALAPGARKDVVLDAHDLSETGGALPALGSKLHVKHLQPSTLIQQIDKSVAVIIDLADSLKDPKAHFEALQFAALHARDEKLKAVAMSGYLESAHTQPLSTRIFVAQSAAVCAQMGQLTGPQDGRNLVRLMQDLPTRTASGNYPGQIALTGRFSAPVLALA